MRRRFSRWERCRGLEEDWRDGRGGFAEEASPRDEDVTLDMPPSARRTAPMELCLQSVPRSNAVSLTRLLSLPNTTLAGTLVSTSRQYGPGRRPCKGAMAPLPGNSRRRDRAADDAGDDESAAASSTRHSNKRARLSEPDLPEHQSWTSTPPAGRIDVQSTSANMRGPIDNSGASATSRTITNGARSLHEHQPGAIVRIAVIYFVTYTAASFFPGPALNMVIGPNGTGKSTLVCAICLGLGWDPKHLGRAKDVSEFIKHGADEATIEIELKRPAWKDEFCHYKGHETQG
ncbi:hypothetical protein MRB53_038427 [Persea americana]|nr:hypothetical protein MRB53_038427 [Persea americana]